SSLHSAWAGSPQCSSCPACWSAPPVRRNPRTMRPVSKSEAVVVTALGTTQTLAWGSTYYLPAILADPIARDLGVPAPVVFGAFSLALIVSAIAGPMAGRWIDQRGGREVLSWSNLFFAAGLAL